MDLLKQFDMHISLTNRSKNTSKAYLSDVSQFVDFIADQERDLTKIEAVHIRHFLAYLSMKGISKKSVSRKLSSLKTFFEFLVKNGNININPAYILKSPKIGRFLPNVLTFEEFQKISNVVDMSTMGGRRDKAILEFMYSSGVRSEELLMLQDQDIDLKNKEAKVTGKGGRERIVFFSSEARRVLLEYMPLKKSKFPESKSLFINKFGERLSSRFLRKLVSEYSGLAGINKEVTPHTFRHSFATLLMDSGVDLKMVQELLGHASISSTQIYTHISREELRKCYDSHALF